VEDESLSELVAAELIRFPAGRLGNIPYSNRFRRVNADTFHSFNELLTLPVASILPFGEKAKA